MNINYQEIIVSIIVGVVSVTLAFYIKDFLIQKNEFRRLRQKLEKVAGKNARVIYNDEIYKVTYVDESGIILNGELNTVFIPTSKLLQTETILPSDRFDEEKKAKQRREEEEKESYYLKSFECYIEKMSTNFLQSSQQETEMARAVLSEAIER